MDTPIPSSHSPGPAPGSLHPLEPVYGWLHPPAESAVEESEVALTLAALGVIGAVDATATGPGSSREFVVLATASGAALELLPDGPLITGRTIAEVAEELVMATGCAVDLGDASVMPIPDSGDEGAGEALHGTPPAPTPFEPEAPTDVLVGRIPASRIPSLARRVASPVEVLHGRPETEGLPEGWTLVRPVERSAQLHRHYFSDRETPVVGLTTIGGRRYVTLLVEPGYLPGAVLSKEAPWSTLTTSDSIAHLDGEDLLALTEALHWFAHPVLAPSSDLLDVYRAVDEAVLSGAPCAVEFDLDNTVQAVESRDDARWSTRVLTALGVPVLAAQVHEGLATPEEFDRVEPAGGLTSLADALKWSPRWRRARGRPARYREE